MSSVLEKTLGPKRRTFHERAQMGNNSSRHALMTPQWCNLYFLKTESVHFNKLAVRVDDLNSQPGMAGHYNGHRVHQLNLDKVNIATVMENNTIAQLPSSLA